MTTKRTLKSDVEQLQEASVDSERDGTVFLYRHDKTGELYDRDKNKVDAETRDAPAFVMEWHDAPFVVERERAEANGWEIARSVEPAVVPNGFTDLVEVVEWHPEPWGDE